MKKITIFTILGIVFSLSFNTPKNSEAFYYYKGEKFFINQRTDRIFVKFAQNADKYQWLRQLTCF